MGLIGGEVGLEKKMGQPSLMICDCEFSVRVSVCFGEERVDLTTQLM